MEWMELIKTVGVPLALLVFFVVETKRREDRMATRLDTVENYARDQLAQIVTQNTSVMMRLERWLERQSGPAAAEIPGEPMAQWDRGRPRQTGDAT